MYPCKQSAIRKVTAKLVLTAVLWSFLHSASLVHAQIQNRPKPGPEHKKLEVWAGGWAYEGSLKETPLGPGGKFSGRETNRWILDGLFLEAKAKDTGVYGGKEITYEGLVIHWYDSATKTYREQAFDNDGFVSAGVETVSGNTWTGTGTATDSKGNKTLTRNSTTFSPDGKTRTSKSEISFDDGKTWTIYWELTATKVSE